MPLIEFNSIQIENAVVDGFAETMMIFHRQLIKEFSQNKWDWPSGQSPRDIVDTNRLRGATPSAPQAKLSPTVYEWTWNVEYALAVHNGAHFIKGPLAGRVFPPRPWTLEPLNQLHATFVKITGLKLAGLL